MREMKNGLEYRVREMGRQEKTWKTLGIDMKKILKGRRMELGLRM